MNWDLFRQHAATRVIKFAMFATITWSDSVNTYLQKFFYTHTHTHTRTHARTHTHPPHTYTESYYM